MPLPAWPWIAESGHTGRARRRCIAWCPRVSGQRGSHLNSMCAIAAWPRGRVAIITLICVGWVLASARAEPLVVCTTPDLKSITEAVGGGAVRVESLVPPGSDAEAFEPRPSHLVSVRNAMLLVRIGLGYDEWLDRLVQQAGSARLRPGGD